MSSTERAPEPTMEEILASIRRIITDDEAGQAQSQNANPKAEDESLEGEADNQIIDDIARVLSGDDAEAPASEEEEILDLAAELGGLEIIEDEGDAVMEVTDVLEVDEVAVAEMASEPLAEPEAGQPQAEELVFTMSETLESAAQPVAEMPQPQEQDVAPPAPPPVQPVQSAGEEAASALERAIAALRAGQASASTKPRIHAESQPDTTPAVEPIPMAVPMASMEVEAETHPEPEPVIQPNAGLDFEAQPDIAQTIEHMTEEQLAEEPLEELLLADAEFTLAEEMDETEPVEKRPFWPVQAEAETEPALEPEPMFEPGPVFEPRSEPAVASFSAQTNGAEAHHDVAAKTLEDSIKDMLRPMLRQWLDENMPRMIREGFDPETLRRRQD